MSKTRARDSKGHFIKSGSKKSKRSKSKALAKRSSSAPATRNIRVSIASPKGKKGKKLRRRHGGGGTGFWRSPIVGGGTSLSIATNTLKSWTPELLAGAGYGWLSGGAGKDSAGKDTIPAQWRATIAKTPGRDSLVKKVGAPAADGAIMLAAGIIAGPGKLRTLAGLGAKAALMRASDLFGRVGGNMEAFVTLSGGGGNGGDDVSMSGDITDAEIVG